MYDSGAETKGPSSVVNTDIGDTCKNCLSSPLSKMQKYYLINCAVNFGFASPHPADQIMLEKLYLNCAIQKHYPCLFAICSLDISFLLVTLALE